MGTKLPEVAVILSVIMLGQRFSGYENKPLGYLIVVIGGIAALWWVHSVYKALAQKEGVHPSVGKFRLLATWITAVVLVGFVAYPWFFPTHSTPTQLTQTTPKPADPAPSVIAKTDPPGKTPRTHPSPPPTIDQCSPPGGISASFGRNPSDRGVQASIAAVVAHSNPATGAILGSFKTSGTGSYEVNMHVTDKRPEELEFRFGSKPDVTIVSRGDAPKKLGTGPLTLESLTEDGFRINDGGCADVRYTVVWIRGSDKRTPNPKPVEHDNRDPGKPSATPSKAKETSVPEQPRPTLSGLFKADFSGIGGVTDGGFDLTDQAGSLVHVDRRLLADFVGRNKFLAFYIASSDHLVDVCMALADIVRPMALAFPAGQDVLGGDSGGMTSIKELTFSGRVFIYHEWPLTNKQKADLLAAYSARQLDLQFRGIDYLTPHLNEWYSKHEHK